MRLYIKQNCIIYVVCFVPCPSEYSCFWTFFLGDEIGGLVGSVHEVFVSDKGSVC